MTGQNTSSAVMQQRAEPHDSLDDFPTPPWATRAICEFVTGLGFDLAMSDCREPCANRGHMVKPLREVFGYVMASDVHDYGHGFPVKDYLFGPDSHWDHTDWTFINPPFRLAREFIERAQRLSRVGVSVIARTSFSEGQTRAAEMFIPHPPSFELQFSERVVMLKGRLVRAGAIDPAAAKPGTKASTATSYSAFIWLKRDAAPADTRKRWIAPCRLRLEREGDYPK
ncbi:methyltransferase [Novosphingobium guangzhouense]|uniref:Methyltransferase n=1 Tax=Novosphingobium guangzhouense TaxID=1850347 RepID=A0A2K2FUP0_9SPHN|nr:methyltransferase [Novosphingobium guangzhouense]PNU02488.1 hypothetical protein A8V01_08885 [Novosphingobium guangzhouense]